MNFEFTIYNHKNFSKSKIIIMKKERILTVIITVLIKKIKSTIFLTVSTPLLNYFSVRISIYYIPHKKKKKC